MSPTPKYFIVEAKALPDIFLKVAEAKRILELREADTVNEATLKVGISRSAFYKYKDAIRPTFQVLLKDEPGVLSSILASFAASGGNILTINQSIPTGGVAAVTLSAETSNLSTTLEELVHSVEHLYGVITFEVLAG